MARIVKPLTADVAALLPKTYEEADALPKNCFGQPVLMERVVDGQRQQLVSCGNELNDKAKFQRSLFDESRFEKLGEEVPVEVILTDPIPTKMYTVASLKEMHHRGIWRWVEVEEDKPTAVVPK